MRFFGRPFTLFLSSAATTSTTVTASFGSSPFGVRGPLGSLRKSTTTMMSSHAENQARVALCQFPVTEDKEVNHRTASMYLTRAAKEGAKLVVMPEIWNGPYATAAFAEYAEVLPNVGDDNDNDNDNDNENENENNDFSPSVKLMQQHAKKYSMWIVGGSIPERESDGKIYNTCLVFDPNGNIVAKHRKAHLFDIDVPGGITFRESDTLSPGQSLTAFDGGDVFGMIGVGICYDIRFPEYALMLNKKHKCKILIYPGAFNLTTGPAHWELLQRARAVDNQCFVLAASPARVERADNDDNNKSKYPHYTAWGHSTVVAPWGDIVATTDEKESLVIADLDMDKVASMRQAIPTLGQKRTDLYQLTEPN